MINTDQALIYRVIPLNASATDPQLVIYGDNCTTCFQSGTALVQAWCLKACTNIPNNKKIIMAPPSIFDKIHPCIAFKDMKCDAEDIDHSFHTSSLLSLQTLFDIHCVNSSPQPEYNWMINFVTVFAAQMGAAFYDDQSEFEYLSTFSQPIQHFHDTLKCFADYTDDFKSVHKEALSLASKFKENYNLLNDVIEESTRTMCLSGISFISALANGTSYSAHNIISNVCPPAERRKHFHSALEEIALYVKKHKADAIHILATLLLLGSRCIQDSTEVNIAVKERTSCCSCGSTVNCFHIQTGKCKPCPKCKKLLCEDCKECHCSFTNYNHLKDMLKQWQTIEILSKKKQDTDDQLSRFKKQNETLCRKNIQFDMEDKKLKYSIEVLEKEKKNQKYELKKMKQEYLKDLGKLETTLHKLRQESVINKKLLHESEACSQIMSSTVIDQDETFTNMSRELEYLKRTIHTLKSNLEKMQNEVKEKENKYEKTITILNSKLGNLEEDNKILIEENKKLELQVGSLTENNNNIHMEKEVEKKTMKLSLQQNEDVIKKLAERPKTKSVATWTITTCSEATTNTDSTEDEKSDRNDKSLLNDRIIRLEKYIQNQSHQEHNHSNQQVIGYPINQYPPPPHQPHQQQYPPPPHLQQYHMYNHPLPPYNYTPVYFPQY